MKFSFSSFAIFITLLTCLAIDFNLKKWEKQDRVIEWDIHGYYGYLPAKFIYDDIKLEKSNYQFGAGYNLFWPIPVGAGKNVIHKTMGLSMLYAPFFFAGNYVAKLMDLPQNGFSEPYKLFLLLSAVFYLFLGLEFVRKTLRYLQFSERHTGLTIILIGLGTNLLAYSSQSAQMMHVYNFFLISAFAYGTINWFDKPSWLHSILIGATAGMISLIYLPNLTVVIFFIITGITKLKDRIKFNNFLKTNYLKIAMLLLTIIVIWIPQLVYWKIVSGNFIYNLPHDGQYFFTKPKLIDGLISWRKGWLIYTPVMMFSLLGIFSFRSDLKYLKLPVITFVILNLYIVFSWWNWWYGGSIGQRPLIDSYAIMALPLASFIQFISNQKIILQISTVCLSLFFVWLNIFQTFQYENNSLHYEGMTKTLYFKQFGKLERIKDFDQYVQYPNNEEAKTGKR